MTVEQFELNFDKKFRTKKKFNAAISGLIFILGLTATIYKAIYEGDFWTCFREMTVCGTVFTTIIALAYIFVSLYELKHKYEFTYNWMYTIRLSSCTTEVIIFVVVMIGCLPFVPTEPTIMRYDMMNMHVIIPILTVISFVFNDSPIGKLTFIEHLNTLAFLLIYTLGQLICILCGTYPAQNLAYFFLDIMHQPVWFTCFVVVVIYGMGYLLGSLFAWLNRKGSWYWYKQNLRRQKRVRK